jgi:LysR family transcriptional regulator, nitrogen assimilation regulatory protein
MNQKDLESFVKVVEAGSFSQAALLMRRPQPALSRHVRELESELRVTLLYRNGRGVVTTEAGRRLYERANAILEQISAARAEALGQSGRGPEHVTIGLPPTVARVLSLKLARALYAAYPEMRLTFTEALNGHLLEWLAAGRMDIAILYANDTAPRLHAEKLFEEELCLVGAGAMPPQIQAASLRDARLILPGRQHGLRRQVESWAGRHGIGLNVRAECDGLSAILQLVAGGLGCTILPENAIRAELERGELACAQIVNPTPQRSMVLATPTNRPITQGLNAVARVIKNVVRDNALFAGTPALAVVTPPRFANVVRHQVPA